MRPLTRDVLSKGHMRRREFIPYYNPNEICKIMRNCSAL